MPRSDLAADCGSCGALCCVATSFEAGEDFAFDKPAGVACPHVTSERRCAIHDDLVGRGFRGCALYDCHGAGQNVTRRFGAADTSEPTRHAIFLALRGVHELLWLLTEAERLCPASSPDLAQAIAVEIATLDAIAFSSGAEIVDADLAPRDRSARALLKNVGHALGGRPPRLPIWRAGRS